MLQSLKRAWRLDSNDARLHECLMRFRVFVEAPEQKNKMEEAVRQVLDRAAEGLCVQREVREAVE